MENIFYRFKDVVLCDGVIKVSLKKYIGVEETPCGWWIKNIHGHGRKRWISNTSRKRYAYPNQEEALESFKARKKMQIAILSGQLDRAKIAATKAENIEL